MSSYQDLQAQNTALLSESSLNPIQEGSPSGRRGSYKGRSSRRRLTSSGRLVIGFGMLLAVTIAYAYTRSDNSDYSYSTTISDLEVNEADYIGDFEEFPDIPASIVNGNLDDEIEIEVGGKYGDLLEPGDFENSEEAAVEFEHPKLPLTHTKPKPESDESISSSSHSTKPKPHTGSSSSSSSSGSGSKHTKPSTYKGTEDRKPFKKASAGALKPQEGGPPGVIHTRLREDRGYLLSWGGEAGWTNVLFGQLKHIHLAKLSNRIPIMPPTRPAKDHLLGHPEDDSKLKKPGPILMSEIFDLPGLAEKIGMPIVEIDEVKGYSWKDSPRDDLWDIVDNIRAGKEWTGKEGIDQKFLSEGGWPPHHDDTWEIMGCWGLELTSRNISKEEDWVAEGAINVRFLPPPTDLIDPMYPPPDGHALIGDIGEALWFSGLDAPYDQVNDRVKLMRDQIGEDTADLKRYMDWHPTWKLPEKVPEEHLTCIDQYLFFTFPKADFTEAPWLDHESYPTNTWTEVGTHLHWRPDVKALAMAILAKAFGLDPNVPMVDYIAVHIRRTDLMWMCEENGKYRDDCYTPQVFRNAIEAVKRKLKKDQGVTMGEHIVFTTDEKDPVYLQSLRDQGFVSVDHDELKTVEKLGLWWPSIIDSVIISSGKGFVGTRGSTMSEVAVRRTEDWQNGVAAQVASWDKDWTKFLGEGDED